jgi:hypothetical protein
MTTPGYFLADLPPEAPLTPSMIEEACLTLRRNRLQYLSGRTTGQMIDLLDHVAREWMRPDSPFRKSALDQGPGRTGFARATIERGLDDFFGRVTARALRGLIEQDLGSAERLDAFAATGPEQAQNKMSVASAPELLAHITAGTLPNPAFMSILLGLLLRSAQFVKCATGGAFLPLLFAHSIHQMDRKAGSCLELASWPGGSHTLERALFDHADCITATGSDESLTRIRLRAPQRAQFAGHGHRVSFGFVSNQLKTRADWTDAAAGAARDVAAWNQLGCLSPHVIYVQTGGLVSPETFASDLAQALDRIEAVEPRGALPTEGAAVIASRRSIYALRAANSEETRMWASADSTAWTVVFESDPRFQVSCLNRFVYVKSASSLTDALRGADAIRANVSAVGVAAPESAARNLALELARWGATRVCPLGKMQAPPLSWRHDGRPALGELIRWTDFEMT